MSIPLKRKVMKSLRGYYFWCFSVNVSDRFTASAGEPRAIGASG
jgi:hypothetical protein